MKRQDAVNRRPSTFDQSEEGQDVVFEGDETLPEPSNGKKGSDRRNNIATFAKATGQRVVDQVAAIKKFARTATMDDLDREQQNLKRQRVFQDNPLFKAVLMNDLETLKQIVHLYKDGKIKLDDRGAVGDTALHVAILFSNSKAATILMNADPEIVNKPNEGWLYKGETALHIAIINQDFEMVKELVERGANVETRATGRFFTPGAGIHCYYGEYPLSFAVSTGQEEIVRYLVEKGAPLDSKDTHGNTALHMLPMMPSQDMAINMYDVLMELNDANIPLEWISNNQGLTLVKLAAFEGKYELFSHLMDKRKQIHWTYGPVTSSVYDLDQIDTYNDTNSVLEVIVKSKHAQEAGKMLDVTPIRQLLQRKWESCCRPWFIAWVISYFIYIVIFTVVCYHRPLNHINITSNTTVSGTVRHKRLSESYSSPGDIWRLVGEIIVILGMISMLVMEIPDLWRKGAKYYFKSTGPFHALIWGYVICIIIITLFRLAEVAWEEIPMSIALVLCWMYFMFFSRGLEKTGPFSVMVQKMLFGDLIRFFAVFCVALVGFSAALYVLYSESHPPVKHFRNFGDAIFTLFELMLGMNEITSIEKARAELMSTFLLCSYVVFAYVLLINLLIALMGHTYKKVSSERRRFWKLQMADLILMIERRLPSRFRVRTGICGNVFGLKQSNWYIRIEEKGSSLKKILRSFVPENFTSDSEDDQSATTDIVPFGQWPNWSLLDNSHTGTTTTETTSGPEEVTKEEIKQFVSADGRERKEIRIVQTRQREQRVMRRVTSSDGDGPVSFTNLLSSTEQV